MQTLEQEFRSLEQEPRTPSRPPAELPTASEMNPYAVEFRPQAETESGTRSGNDYHRHAGTTPWKLRRPNTVGRLPHPVRDAGSPKSLDG